MTPEEIIELLIRAAAVDRALPVSSGPAKLKAASFGFVYSVEDMVGWLPEDDKPIQRRLSTNDVGIWEAAMDIVKLVPNSGQRRALWFWAASKAGGRSFAKWCRNVEHIQPMTGDYRRKRAIMAISKAFDCKAIQHNENGVNEDFTKYPEICDKEDTIRNDVPRSWMAVDARPMACDFDSDLKSFEWSDMANQRRREKDAMRREREARQAAA